MADNNNNNHVEITNFDMMPALHRAAADNNVAELKRLIEE
jgi:hypothetical protein